MMKFSDKSSAKRPRHEKARKHKSEQSKLLTRRLTIKLLRDIAIYTVAFAIMAFAANAMLVPRLANWVADNTSAWQNISFRSTAVEDAIKELGAEVYFIVNEPYELWEIGNKGLIYHMLAIDGGDESSLSESDYEALEKIISASAASSGEIPGESLTEDVDGGQSYDSSENLSELERISAEYSVVLNDTADGDSIIKAWGMYPLTQDQIVGTMGNQNTALLLCRIDEKPAEWFSVISLQEMATMNLVGDGAFGLNTQVMQRDESSVWVRELSTYSYIREFKIPVAIAVYLMGLLIVILLGYGRSLRYYDDLVSAVASLVGEREKPIKLPSVLAATQSELNEIRLASLADERAAQAAERRKDELVAYLAHDVKTPLTSVIGYLTLLDEAPDMPEEARRRYIQTAFQKSERLEELIDEFFEITRYNLQAIPIERTKVDIRLLCEQVVEEFYPEANSRGLSLRVAVDPKAEGSIFVDPDKLARALGNVVRNAVAYADAHTEVRVSAERKIQILDADEETRRQVCWVIKVANRGREISEAHLESIFDKFYREEKSRTSTSGRAGLGLAIAKEIVLAHGGEIFAKSSDGRTVFTIILPA